MKSPLSNTIRELRAARSMTQQELADLIAVTRQTVSGEPPGGWAPAERLSREEALRAFTIDAAYAAHAEQDLGSIQTGKLADFVVLSRDIMKAPPADILRATIVRTIVAGRAVYSAPAASSSQ